MHSCTKVIAVKKFAVKKFAVKKSRGDDLTCAV